MKKLKFLAVSLALLLVLPACSNKAKIEDQPQNGQNNQQEEVKQEDLRYLDASLPIEERVESLLGQMSLMEKAGQMLQVERNRVSTLEMTSLRIGSVLSGGGSVPGNNTVQDWNDMFQQLQDAALKTTHKIPMIYGIDSVHGHSNLKGAVIFPHNIGLGAANDPELMYQMGAAVAEEMKLTNSLFNFSPCVAIGNEPRWGRTYESFSSDTQIVTSLAEAYLKGLTEHGVAATAKHYIADGSTTYGTGEINGLFDRGDSRLTEEELREKHLPPYQAMVDGGVQFIMPSYSSINGLKMHENKYLINDVLKNELGFEGVVISDYEAMNALSGINFEAKITNAINAGVDMLMEPNNYKDAINAIVSSVNKGNISEERIDDAVRRILTVKFKMGLFDDPYQEKLTHEVTELGSEQYRSIAKQLVEKSLVLLKNDNQLLPLKQGQKIFVTGPAMDDMGMQCGGWTISWQGQLDGENGKVTEGTTILEGLMEYAQIYGLEIITDQERAGEADLVLMAIGEVPYAEFEGDTADMSIVGKKAHPENEATIDYVESLDKPVVTLIIAGRNVILEDYMNQWDSIVMCYLPGSEGDGIASVLFGEKDFTGKLAMPYYRKVEDIGKEKVELLFDLGYGLSYDR